MIWSRASLSKKDLFHTQKPSIVDRNVLSDAIFRSFTQQSTIAETMIKLLARLSNWSIGMQYRRPSQAK